MKTINDVISMKNKKNSPFVTEYSWLIQTIENNLISKSNGSERVQQLLFDYDDTSRLFIIHQFTRLGEVQIANELLHVLKIDIENTFLEDKYVNELLDSISVY